MSRQVVYFLITLFLNLGAGNELCLSAQSSSQTPPGSTPEARGAWVAEQVDAREAGKDARLAMRMRLYDRQDRVRERALTLESMRGGPGRPVSGDRALIRFTYPNDIKNTGFLIWEHPKEDDERFLYLPALGRVRRIAGSETQESFVGSDFTYEDIGGRQLEDYTYRLIDAPAEWTAPDGSKHPVFALESKSRAADARFPRVVSLIRRDNVVVVFAEIRNRRDEIQKEYVARKVEKVDGYWTVTEMVMRDLGQRTRTELVVERAEYDVGLSPDAFSRRALEGTGR
ncbi:MAG TPA: outer membrane lipoprotein-sorting protein [Vicinamibacterales bacterium]|nr:outer membrane lipoprotein-sorting protein [Vicinamibacterales bacterium]